MSIKTADNQKLDALFAAHKDQYGGRREDYFAFLHLTRKFKVEISEIAHQVAFGSNDYGIDAYFIDKETRNLYLYQFKWSEDHGQFKGSMERLAKDGLARVFGNPTQDPKQAELITYLKKDLKEHREAIDRVYLHFVFKGDVDAADRNEGLANRREDICYRSSWLMTLRSSWLMAIAERARAVPRSRWPSASLSGASSASLSDNTLPDLPRHCGCNSTDVACTTAEVDHEHIERSALVHGDLPTQDTEILEDRLGLTEELDPSETCPFRA